MGTTPARQTSDPVDDVRRGSTSVLDSTGHQGGDERGDEGAGGVRAAPCVVESGELTPPRRRVVVAWSGDPAAARAHPRPTRRRRSWWLAALVLLSIVIAGVVVTGVRIERDLERRGLEALVAAGAVGVDITFSGQDAEVSCGVPQADPVALARVVRDVRGVRTVRLADSCAGVVSAAAAEPAAAAAAAAPAELAVPAGPVATAAPAVEPVASGPVATGTGETVGGGTLPPVVTLSVTAVLDGEQMVLSGTVPSAADRDALVSSAAALLGADRVVDRLQVLPDAAVGVDDVEATLAATARLVAIAAAHLVTGTVSLDRATLGVTGVYATAADLTAVRAEADAVGAGMQVSPQAQTSTQAATVAELLNQIVTAEPIVFRSGDIELDESAGAVLDRIAAVASRYEGVSIVVVGHTDSAGDAAWNQVLSEWRALAVAAALMERGVRVPLDARGEGEREPVIVDGVEDPVASRRVEFVVIGG